MSFHNVIFPEEISYGSKGGPQFNTTVLTLASGYEKRNINWSMVQAKYDVVHGIKTREQMEELLSFFVARQGKAYSFRFLDHLDYRLTDSVLTANAASPKKYQLKKRYVSGEHYYDRLITKPIEGTLFGVRVNGGLFVENDTGNNGTYTVDYNTGVIEFAVLPPGGAEVTVDSCEFHVHCRFDTDHFDATHEFWETTSWSAIPILEIKEKGL